MIRGKIPAPKPVGTHDVGAIVTTPFGLGKVMGTCRKDNGQGKVLVEVTILSLDKMVYLQTDQVKRF